jgi:hypothetical protein
MPYPRNKSHWRDLESQAQCPEVQEFIRREIQCGTIRVQPNPAGGIRIVPIAEIKSGELSPSEPIRLQFKTREAR